jgi:hypothetical protein
LAGPVGHSRLFRRVFFLVRAGIPFPHQSAFTVPGGAANIRTMRLGTKHRLWIVALAAGVIAAQCIGCGTTRRSDTTRTATEQMLLSDAVDRAVSRIDFGLLSGQEVFLDSTYLGSSVDKEYVISTLRQHMLACGCVLKDKKEDATLIVEVRAGAVGTDRHDLMFGVPSTTVSLGALSPVPGTPTMVPEIAFAKRTDQIGVAKLAVFAYERATGTPVWQSGSDIVASRARDLWVFGTGPFQRGNIYDGPMFAGDELRVPLLSSNQKRPPVRVARERKFNAPIAAKQSDAAQGEQEQVASAAGAATDASNAPKPETPDENAAQHSQVSLQNDLPGRGAAQSSTSIATQPSRSQFDSVWELPPLDSDDPDPIIADRRWPTDRAH